MPVFGSGGTCPSCCNAPNDIPLPHPLCCDPGPPYPSIVRADLPLTFRWSGHATTTSTLISTGDTGTFFMDISGSSAAFAPPPAFGCVGKIFLDEPAGTVYVEDTDPTPVSGTFNLVADGHIAGGDDAEIHLGLRSDVLLHPHFSISRPRFGFRIRLRPTFGAFFTSYISVYKAPNDYICGSDGCSLGFTSWSIPMQTVTSMNPPILTTTATMVGTETAFGRQLDIDVQVTFEIEGLTLCNPDDLASLSSGVSSGSGGGTSTATSIDPAVARLLDQQARGGGCIGCGEGYNS